MTHAEIENPGDLFANIAKTVLLADTPAWPCAVYAHRESGASNVARTDCTASGFTRASDHMDFANIANVATPFYNHRKGRLAFAQITPVAYRSVAANANVHAYCTGRIGYLCDRVAQKFTASACSGLIVLNIEDVGETPAESETTDTDRTTRNFDIEYIIPPAVFAAAT